MGEIAGLIKQQAPDADVFVAFGRCAEDQRSRSSCRKSTTNSDSRPIRRSEAGIAQLIRALKDGSVAGYIGDAFTETAGFVSQTDPEIQWDKLAQAPKKADSNQSSVDKSRQKH